MKKNRSFALNAALAFAALLGLTGLTGQANAQVQGVSKSEILIGTIQDLSGPLAGYGKDVRNGLTLRIAEINEQGGVHGRKLKLLVEDNSYDPKKAVLAAQKLVTQDKVFVMAGLLGTGTNLAANPILFEKNVVNFFPMALAREMYLPLHKLKFAFASSYFEQMALAVPRLYKDKKATKACTIYQDDDYGLEVVRGAEAGLKSINVELSERTSFKRGATDFSSQVAKLKAANCDLVVMGTIIRETVGTIAEARKLGYNPIMVASAAAYTDLIPRLGGKAMDGFYAMTLASHPYEDEQSPGVRFWAVKYKTAFGDSPTVTSVYGYVIADRLISAMQKAGPNLTTDALVKAIEGLKTPMDLFGMPAMSFSASNHLGSSESRLSQIQGGRWKVVIDYDQMR